MIFQCLSPIYPLFTNQHNIATMYSTTYYHSHQTPPLTFQSIQHSPATNHSFFLLHIPANMHTQSPLPPSFISKNLPNNNTWQAKVRGPHRHTQKSKLHTRYRNFQRSATDGATEFSRRQSRRLALNRFQRQTAAPNADWTEKARVAADIRRLTSKRGELWGGRF